MNNFKAMNFDEFWAKLTELLRTKHDFSTTDQGKEFDARNAIDEISITPSSSGEKRGIITMDGLTRFNCGVKVNDFITIKKIEGKIAKQITLTPLDDPAPPIDERYFNDALDGVSFIKAGIIMVPYFGGRLSYKINKTVPTGAIIVSKETEFVILDRTKSSKKKTLGNGKTQKSLKASKKLQKRVKLINRRFDPHKHYRRISLESIKELAEIQKQIEKTNLKK